METTPPVPFIAANVIDERLLSIGIGIGWGAQTQSLKREPPLRDLGPLCVVSLAKVLGGHV